jgi:hypothetical protein
MSDNLIMTTGALFIAGAIAGLAIKKVVKGSESGGCGCTGAIETKEADCGCSHQETTTMEAPGCCGGEVQAYESEYSIPRVNPVAVEGAEDVYGAEGTSDPVVGGIPVADLGEWPINRDYYQTHAGLGHPTETYYDSYNDFLPEYRFPAPWSPSYNPRDVYRGPDYTIQQTASSGRLV